MAVMRSGCQGWAGRLRPVGVFVLLVLLVIGCETTPTGGGGSGSGSGGSPAAAVAETQRRQSAVMEMADEYIAALGEAFYIETRSDQADARARRFAQSFLRNGVGASMDIATSPNPSVAVVDLLVLVSLQRWSLEANWIPRGIGPALGEPALARLKRAEADAWAASASILSKSQRATLRELIDAWIKRNPDRMVVSLVRFEEFAEERGVGSAPLRGQVLGLLREVSQASGAIDDARLFGERALWYAGRYPYLVGQQAELTAYRLGDQPEVDELLASLTAVREAADASRRRLDSLNEDVSALRDTVFEGIATERQSAIEQAREAAERTGLTLLADAEARASAERERAIEAVFDAIARERQALLEALETGEGRVQELLVELRTAAEASARLASELTTTVEAVDRVVARFDAQGPVREPTLKVTDVRDAAAETAAAAERIVRVLEITNELAAAGDVDETARRVAAPLAGLIDRVFWRSAALVVLLIAGLAVLRLLPRRRTAGPGSAVP